MGRKKDEEGTALGQLRAFGLRYPGAHTKSPWPGHLDLAVKDKTFAYLSVDGEPIKISCKLPLSADAALSLPFAEPTAYGLGKSGWVTATFSEDSEVPIELFEQWIDESYRAQAPKRLSASVPEGGPGEGITATTVTAKGPRAKAPAVRSTTRQSRAPRGPAAGTRSPAPSGAKGSERKAGPRTPTERAATAAAKASKVTGASKKRPRSARG
jgi:predicted DNA-binding protein (MmcQ/YjbR family)